MQFNFAHFSCGDLDHVSLHRDRVLRRDEIVHDAGDLMLPSQ